MEEGAINMIIGVPKEIKNNENRVAITPSGVTTFVQARSLSNHRNWCRSWKWIY
jgi:hypothetical protein